MKKACSGKPYRWIANSKTRGCPRNARFDGFPDGLIAFRDQLQWPLRFIYDLSLADKIGFSYPWLQFHLQLELTIDRHIFLVTHVCFCRGYAGWASGKWEKEAMQRSLLSWQLQRQIIAYVSNLHHGFICDWGDVASSSSFSIIAIVWFPPIPSIPRRSLNFCCRHIALHIQPFLTCLGRKQRRCLSKYIYI